MDPIVPGNQQAQGLEVQDEIFIAALRAGLRTGLQRFLANLTTPLDTVIQKQKWELTWSIQIRSSGKRTA